MNSASFIGRIGRDATTRTAGKSDATSWPIAVDVGFGESKTTMWIDCTMWGERGSKIAGYITKGDRIGVTGEVSLRTYEKDGETKTALCLRVADVTLLGEKKEAARTPAPPRAPARNAPPADDFDDSSIPF